MSLFDNCFFLNIVLATSYLHLTRSTPSLTLKISPYISIIGSVLGLTEIQRADIYISISLLPLIYICEKKAVFMSKGERIYFTCLLNIVLAYYFSRDLAVYMMTFCSLLFFDDITQLIIASLTKFSRKEVNFGVYVCALLQTILGGPNIINLAMLAFCPAILEVKELNDSIIEFVIKCIYCLVTAMGTGKFIFYGEQAAKAIHESEQDVHVSLQYKDSGDNWQKFKAKFPDDVLFGHSRLEYPFRLDSKHDTIFHPEAASSRRVAAQICANDDKIKDLGLPAYDVSSVRCIKTQSGEKSWFLPETPAVESDTLDIIRSRYTVNKVPLPEPNTGTTIKDSIKNRMASGT